MFGKNKGWRTKTGAILAGIGCVLGMAIYFISGPEATLALSPAAGLPMVCAAFGLDGARDAIAKVLDGIDGKKE